MNPRTSSCLFGAALTLGVTACSSGTASAPASHGTPAASRQAPATQTNTTHPGAAGSAPCSLLTASDVQAAIGAAVGAGTSKTPADCTYTAADGRSATLLVAAKPFSQLLSTISTIGMTPVARIGDRALMRLPELIVFGKAGSSYEVLIDLKSATSVAANTTALKQLATDVVAHL